jgi:hypothetical protein
MGESAHLFRGVVLAGALSRAIVLRVFIDRVLCVSENLLDLMPTITAGEPAGRRLT